MIARFFLALLPGVALVFSQALPAAMGQTVKANQPLNFGRCEAIPNEPYAVTPTSSQAGGCPFAQAAKFTISGTVNTTVTITLDSNVVITNGSQNLTIFLGSSEGSGSVCLGTTGVIVLWVGGTTTIPSDIYSTGLFSNNSANLDVFFTENPCL